MGIVQTLVTVGGVLAIIGLLALLFCHYLGGWTWTKAWLRSSGEEKMVLTRAGTHRHFNPNGYMVSSESDLNISGRGSFRRFDTTDHDYQLFRQGSNSSLTRQQYHLQGPNNYIPPQPLRPAPILISAATHGHLTPQSSLDSVFTAPPSPALQSGFGSVVPKIPPPPQQQHTGSTSTVTTSSTSHASQKYSIMGDGNNDRDVGAYNSGGGENGSSNNFSSTNPFLPLLQASSQFFTQTIQSFQSGQNSRPQNVSAPIGTVTSTVDAEPQKQGYDGGMGSTSTPFGSLSSSTSTIPPGLSMGEILFSAPPSYSSNIEQVETFNQQNKSISSNTAVPTPETNSSAGLQPSPKHPNSRPVPSRSNSGSPQHTRYNLHHQNSAENVTGSTVSSHGGVHTAIHSPTPGSVSTGIRRASYPNRKEYTPHDSIPKSEFPQHIPYIPSLHHHHHHHAKSGSVGSASVTVISDRKVGVATDAGVVGAGGNGSFNDPLRHHHHIHHHHYIPSTGGVPNRSQTEPFLEEQEEPPEEPCSNHQLPKSSNQNLDLEKEDLTNRIMLETMREEIRIANERMANATKSLMMDEVFLPTPTTQGGSNSDDGSHPQSESSRKRNFSVSGGSVLSTTDGDVSGSISGKEAGGRIGEGIGISAFTLNSNSTRLGEPGSKNVSSSTTGLLRRSSTPNSSKNSSIFNSSYSSLLQSSSRPTTLVQQHQPPICVNNRGTSNETDSTSRTGIFNTTNTLLTGRKEGETTRKELYGNYADDDSSTNNGYRNGRAVNNSANNITPSTGVMSSSKITSGTQPSTESIGTEIPPSQTSSLQSVYNNSTLGGTVNNVVASHNVTSSSTAATTNRPPTVGSYFRQNSRSFSLRQSSTDSIGSDSDLSSPTEGSLPSLQRAMSCDSVCSDTSVILGDLDPPHMTGHLCIGLEYDSETADLLVNVMEAKELVGPDPDPHAPFDSYVRVYLLPDKTTNMQTRVYRKSLCPAYKEKFMFGLELCELANRSLVFYLYATDKYTNTLIGEAELKLGDIDLTQPVVTWLLLTDTGQRGGEFGEIMFSLSYLPTAERLTVVVVKARNLKFPHERESGDPFVKVYLLQRGKKVSKKKSSTKRGERNPIFNEAMIFSIPAHALQTIQLRITVADSLEAEGRAYSIGHVIVGSVATGKPLSHWNQMLSSLRKPIAMWHALRK